MILPDSNCINASSLLTEYQLISCIVLSVYSNALIAFHNIMSSFITHFNIQPSITLIIFVRGKSASMLLSLKGVHIFLKVFVAVTCEVLWYTISVVQIEFIRVNYVILSRFIQLITCTTLCVLNFIVIWVGLLRCLIWYAY